MLNKARKITDRLSMSLFGQCLRLRVEQDVKGGGRVFVQVVYDAPCTRTGEVKEWRGRKWYLSEHMMEQEVIFTCYLAFKLAVEHEVMEGFKVDGVILVNPHVNYLDLLAISQNEVQRAEKQ